MTWRRTKIGNIASVSYGFTAKASFEVSGPKFLRITDIQNDKVEWAEVPQCSIDDKNHSKQKLLNDDIVFARTGATTGKSYIVKAPPNAVAASYLIRLRVTDPQVLPDFVAKYFQTEEYWRHVNAGVSGSAQGGFNASKLSKLAISLPPLAEQKRIVAILDEAFEGIDAAIANTQANLAAARDLFESDLNLSVFQKGAVWQERELSEVCEITSVLIDPKLPQYAHLPHVGAGNIKAKTGELENIRTAEEEQLISGKFLFDNTMVLYSKIRPYLEKVVRPEFEGLCSADIYPLKPKPGLNRNFLFFMLLSRKFTDYAILGSGRAGMPKVNRNHLFKFPCSIPPIGKQIEIAQRLDLLLEETCQLQKVYQKKLAALHELKQSILAKAFRGELTQEEIAA